MRRFDKRGSAPLALLLSAVLCLGCFCQLSGMDTLEYRISYLWESPVSMPSAAEVYRLHQEGLPVNALWWTHTGKQEIGSEPLQRQVQVSALALCGSSGLLFPEAAALEYEDTDRCLLGRETAARLFGDDQVEGLRVSFGEREYEVAGVLQDIKELFVYELDAGEKQPLQRLTADCDGSGSKAAVRNQVEGLYAPEALLDFDLLYFLGQLAALIIPVCFLWTVWSRVRRSELKKSVRLVLLWGMPLLFLFLSVNWLKVPVDFIPVKWSDFDFFRGLWQEKQAGLQRFFTTALTPPDLHWIRPLLRAALLETGAAVCFAYGTGRWKAGKEWGNGKDRIKKCIESLRKKHKSGEGRELNR